MTRRFSLIGNGRAGGSLLAGLTGLGWESVGVYGRDDDISQAATGVDACVIATPDSTVSAVAKAIEPSDGVVVHLSGALGLHVLAPHRAGALHPLVSLADPVSGVGKLRNAYFALAGDPIVEIMAEQLSGRHFPIADVDRALYHATAAIASNHFVALMGQVDRLANDLGIPFEVFLPLVSSTLDNVGEFGPEDALTGPAARGDTATIEKHRAALAAHHGEELAAYDVMTEQARKLSGRSSKDVER